MGTDPTQRRQLDEIEQQIASAQSARDTVAEIDDAIAADHQLYLKAYFAGDTGKATFYVYDVARLENLRNLVLRRAVQ